MRMRGLKGVLGCSKTLGGPVESGVSTASFETAREDALTSVSSGQNNLQQSDLPGTAVASHRIRAGQDRVVVGCVLDLFTLC